MANETCLCCQAVCRIFIALMCGFAMIFIILGCAGAATYTGVRRNHEKYNSRAECLLKSKAISPQENMFI